MKEATNEKTQRINTGGSGSVVAVPLGDLHGHAL